MEKIIQEIVEEILYDNSKKVVVIKIKKWSDIAKTGYVDRDGDIKPENSIFPYYTKFMEDSLNEINEDRVIITKRYFANKCYRYTATLNGENCDFTENMIEKIITLDDTEYLEYLI